MKYLLLYLTSMLVIKILYSLYFFKLSPERINEKWVEKLNGSLEDNTDKLLVFIGYRDIFL